MTRVTYRCPKCGGAECGFDATSRWDDEAQAWVLGSTYDSGWCTDCGDLDELDERPLDAAPAAIIPALALGSKRCPTCRRNHILAGGVDEPADPLGLFPCVVCSDCAEIYSLGADPLPIDGELERVEG